MLFVFFVPCSCSLSFIWSIKQKQEQRTARQQQLQRTMSTQLRGTNEHKRQEHSQTTVNVVVVVYCLLLLYISCCWMCSLFLVLGSWVDGFVMSVLFIANDYCSCYLFHIRVLCSILFSKTKPRSGNTKARKPQQ